MRDRLGKRPKIVTVAEALDVIQSLAEDKRSHVLLRDDNDWLQLRMKEIAYWAKRARRLMTSRSAKVTLAEAEKGESDAAE